MVKETKFNICFGY